MRSLCTVLMLFMAIPATALPLHSGIVKLRNRIRPSGKIPKKVIWTSHDPGIHDPLAIRDRVSDKDRAIALSYRKRGWRTAGFEQLAWSHAQNGELSLSLAFMEQALAGDDPNGKTSMSAQSIQNLERYLYIVGGKALLRSKQLIGDAQSSSVLRVRHDRFAEANALHQLAQWGLDQRRALIALFEDKIPFPNDHAERNLSSVHRDFEAVPKRFEALTHLNDEISESIREFQPPPPSASGP